MRYGRDADSEGDEGDEFSKDASRKSKTHAPAGPPKSQLAGQTSQKRPSAGTSTSAGKPPSAKKRKTTAGGGRHRDLATGQHAMTVQQMIDEMQSGR